MTTTGARTAAVTEQAIPILTQANFVGQGFDITGKYKIPDSLILPILDPSKVGTREFDFLGHTYLIPAFVTGAQDTGGDFLEDTCSSRDEFQNSIAIKASVDVGYGAFSGHMEASYGREFASSSEYFYSFRNFYSRIATLSLLLDEANAALSNTFVQRYEALPGRVAPDTIDQFAEFFNDFGPYVTSRVNLGASLEYYVAVATSTQMSKTDISAQVKAEYKGLFFSGGISTDITNTDAWKKYSSSRHVKISVSGGDPALVAQLGNVDPSTPSMDSVKLYNAWADSTDTAPAVSDFSLIPVWKLIRDASKAAVVQEAFGALKTSMRPRLVIETSSTHGKPPVITLGKPVKPPAPPEHPIGFQLVILDRSDISVDSIRHDEYYGVNENSWYDAYERMYDAILADIDSGGFNSSKYVIVLASYGMSTNAPPNFAAYSVLRSAGGGEGLKEWVDRADPGSSMNLWPGVYTLVGVFGLGPDTGAELFRYTKAPEQLDVYFYRQRGAQYYTFAAGSTFKPPTEESESVRRAFTVTGKDQVFVEAIE
jgi:MAC/Perforin domain